MALRADQLAGELEGLLEAVTKSPAGVEPAQIVRAICLTGLVLDVMRRRMTGQIERTRDLRVLGLFWVSALSGADPAEASKVVDRIMRDCGLNPTSDARF